MGPLKPETHVDPSTRVYYGSLHTEDKSKEGTTEIRVRSRKMYLASYEKPSRSNELRVVHTRIYVCETGSQKQLKE